MFIFYWMKESFINQNVGVETKMRFKNVIYTNLNRPTVPSGPFRIEKPKTPGDRID